MYARVYTPVCTRVRASVSVYILGCWIFFVSVRDRMRFSCHVSLMFLPFCVCVSVPPPLCLCWGNTARRQQTFIESKP